jgi:hypothetical protein
MTQQTDLTQLLEEMENLFTHSIVDFGSKTLILLGQKKEILGHFN